MDFEPSDLEATVRVLEEIARRQFQGDARALPRSPKNPASNVYDALYATVYQPGVEGIIYDEGAGKYYLARRQAGQTDFGLGRVHIFGGWMKPLLKDASLGDYLVRTAKEELGADIALVAGPIFSYAWQRGEHPIGFPQSLGYVMCPNGAMPEDASLGKWYDVGTLPTVDEMFTGGKVGENHFMFLRAFFQWVKQGGNCPCIDLNVNPM